jgi:hypothetical protein
MKKMIRVLVAVVLGFALGGFAMADATGAIFPPTVCSKC